MSSLDDGWSRGPAAFGRRFGRPEFERAVGSTGVVVADVLPEDAFEVSAVDDQEPVEALAVDRADPTPHVRVRVRRPLASSPPSTRRRAHVLVRHPGSGEKRKNAQFRSRRPWLLPAVRRSHRTA